MNPKEQFRMELFESMCSCAENANVLYHGGSGKEALIGFLERCPDEFIPTREDKTIFNRIINDNLEALWEEYQAVSSHVNMAHIGARVMTHFYYPYYKNIPWIREERR